MYSYYFLKRITILCLMVMVSNIAIAQIIPPVQFSGNLCTDAKSVSVGSCDVLFDIPDTFTNSGESISGCTPNKDGWASFTTDDSGDYLIRYTNKTGAANAAIALYSGTCGSLAQVGACVNSPSSPDELLATGLSASTTYYIRIMDIFGTSAMEGTLCVLKQYAQDSAGDALSARKLAVGSCNVRFDVNGTESPIADPTITCGGITPTANTETHKDAWATFEATGGDVLAVEFQAEDGSAYPAIVIYRDNGGTPDEDLDPSVAIYNACYNGATTSSSFAKKDFTIPAGVPANTVFYIRIIRMDKVVGDMDGSLCIYNGTKQAQVRCGTAFANKLAIGDCNVQFNVFAGGGVFNQNHGPNGTGCASISGIFADVWGAFDATAGQEITIKYDNDNNDPSQATNIIMEVYQDKGTCASVGSTGSFSVSDLVTNGCSNVLIEGVETLSFTAPATDTYYIRIVNGSSTSSKTINGTLCIIEGALTPEDLCFTSKDIGVGNCDVEFNVTDKGFIDNESYGLPSCAGSPSGYRDGWMNFKALSDRTRIQYQHDAGQDAVLAVYSGDCSSLTLLSCSNLVTGTATGGTEDIEIATVAGQPYFIRVMNVTATGDLTGKMCVNKVINRDDCDDSTIQEIPVGSCSVLFDLPASYGASSATAGAGTCGGTVTVQKDGWARFSGNGGDITITYESNDGNSNPFIEITRGTGCSVRSFVACSGQNCSGNQIEQVTVPTTINGATYYVRVVNTNPANGGTMTGYICIYNSSTIPPATVTSKISTNNCASANTISVGDCGLRMNILTSSAACVSDLTNFTNSGASVGTCAPLTPVADAWSTFTSINAGIHTIEYSNENQDLSVSNDVAIAVYSGTCGALVFEACANNIASGAEGIEKLTFTATATTQYFVRIMNISSNNTGTYGKLCVFEGTSLANPDCSAAPDLAIGTIDEQFNIESSYGLDNSNPTVISNCVLSGAANKDVWAKFTTGANIDSAMTVVYDNNDGDAITSLDDDVVNVGVAIYELGSGVGLPCNNLTLVACANSVGEGRETITFSTKTDGAGNIIPTTYYIRIISTEPGGVQGKVSIFPFVQCTLGSERVRDGHFTGFNKNFVGINTNQTDLENDQKVQVFASDYGYRPDINTDGTRGELGPEGYYSVANSANNVHSAFYAYGYPYTGWGPGPNDSRWQSRRYCTTGDGVNSDACPYVAPSVIEASYGNNANLLIVNGRQERGKFWCQTMYPLTEGSYYVFTAWFNSLIPTDRSSLDDPQLRITICEGSEANPLYNGTTSNVGITLTAVNANAYFSAHSITDAASVSETTADVVHRPAHPGVNATNDGDFPDWAPVSSYGAAVSCGNNNIDLKVLNSDVFLPESPDQWVPMRCIYKAPARADGDAMDVNQVNLCIENISSTANGNDFGIDHISFVECTNSADPEVKSALQSTGCELTSNPTVLGIPLNIRLVELKGILRGNKVFLDWLTLTEQGASRFELQRAVVGGEFKSLHTINAKGYSDVPTPYNYVDTDLPVGQQFVFYRLKAYTIDNTFGYSPIVKVEISEINKMHLQLVPNPVTAKTSSTALYFETPKAGEATVTISNTMGVRTSHFTVETIAGANKVNLPVQNLVAGIYVIRITQGTLAATKKLVVNK